MDFLSSLVKYILYIINLVIVIIGVLIIVLGSVTLSSVGQLNSLDDAINTATLPILIIVLGVIVFLVAFFGCCGAIKNNVCLMGTYTLCIGILMVLTLALVVWSFFWKNSFLDSMADIVTTTWNKNTAGNGYPMNTIERIFECCGLNSYSDYNGNVPDSCCGIEAVTCSASIYQTKPGCKTEFVDFWSSNISIIRYAGLIVAAVELGVVLFSSCVTNAMRRQQRREQY